MYHLFKIVTRFDCLLSYFLKLFVNNNKYQLYFFYTCSKIIIQYS